jgi:hypothetical protein
MHIDRTHQITVSREPASAACPISSLGLVFMPTARTLARCSSFGASEARNVSRFRFVGEIVDILAIFPASQTLIVMSAMVLIAHTVRIADEESTHVVRNTEVDHLACGLVSLVTDAPLRPSALLVFSALQFLPATGIFLAPGLISHHLPHLLMPLAFERADGTPCHDQGLPGSGRDSSEVDFTEVDRCLYLPWSKLRRRGFNAYMQFKAVVPHKRTRSAIFRQIKGQDKGWAPFAHRQEDPPLFFAHCLSRPGNGVKALGTPGVLHFHLRMGFAKLTRGFHIGKKSV